MFTQKITFVVLITFASTWCLANTPRYEFWFHNSWFSVSDAYFGQKTYGIYQRAKITPEKFRSDAQEQARQFLQIVTDLERLHQQDYSNLQLVRELSQNSHSAHTFQQSHIEDIQNEYNRNEQLLSRALPVLRQYAEQATQSAESILKNMQAPSYDPTLNKNYNELSQFEYNENYRKTLLSGDNHLIRSDAAKVIKRWQKAMQKSPETRFSQTGLIRTIYMTTGDLSNYYDHFIILIPFDAQILKIMTGYWGEAPEFVIEPNHLTAFDSIKWKEIRDSVYGFIIHRDGTCRNRDSTGNGCLLALRKEWTKRTLTAFAKVYGLGR